MNANLIRRVEWLWRQHHPLHGDADTFLDQITVIRETVESQAAAGPPDGAHIHLVSGTQTVSVGGEPVEWSSPHGPIYRLNFAEPTFPATAITIQEPGYYDVAVQAGWATWRGGGSVTVVRTRVGTDLTVWPPAEDPGLWSTTHGRVFEGVAPAVPLQTGDSIKVLIDHDDGSTHDLASATLGLYLVDREGSKPQYVSVVLADGPIAYWRLDELEGTSAIDSTGNGHTGTYSGSPTLAAAGVMRDGSGSPSVDFDGSNDRLTGLDWPEMDFVSGAFSLEAWFNADALDATTQIIIQKREGGLSKLGWEMGVISSGAFFTDDTDVAIVSSAALSNDTDYHLVVTFDGTNTTRMYLNGVLVDTDTGGLTITANTVTVSVGFDSGEGGPDLFHFDGQLDEVAVYDRALTSAEVAEHHAVGRTG